MIQKPYIVDRDSDGQALYPIGEQQGLYNESWLQKTIEHHPGILPVQEIETIFSPLVSIGREVQTDTGGKIDNLFISPGGYITLVETKLWKNSEARRDVLTQVIDYATSVSQWTYGDLDQVVRAYSYQSTDREKNLVNWVKDHYDIDPFDFEKNVSKNLKRGRFLALIVGDRIRQEFIDYLDRAIQTTRLGIHIELVELRCFTMEADQEWPLFVVPYIPTEMKVVEHHVQVGEFPSAPTYSYKPVQTTARRSYPVSRGSRSVREKLSEKEFWDELKSNDEEGYALAKDLIEYIRTIQNIKIELETTSIVARLYPYSTFTIFYIHTDGRLATSPINIANKLNRERIDSSVFGDYEYIVRDVLGMRGNEACKKPIVEVDLNIFKREVTALIDRINSFRRR